MLINLRTMLKAASAKKMAVGAFNVYNVESLQAVFRSGIVRSMLLLLLPCKIHSFVIHITIISQNYIHLELRDH